MREQNFASIQRAAGAKSFDMGFFEVRASLCHVATLQLGNCLAFVHLLTGGQGHIHEATTERSVDMDQMRRVCFDTSWNFEHVTDALYVNRLDLEAGLRRVGRGL